MNGATYHTGGIGEMAHAEDLKSSGEILEGSSPSSRTTKLDNKRNLFAFNYSSSRQTISTVLNLMSVQFQYEQLFSIFTEDLTKMNTQEAINLVSKFLETKSHGFQPLDQALEILLAQASSLPVEKLTTELHLLTPPLRCFIIPGSRPELKGLEVAFDAVGYMGARCVSDKSAGFHLTREAAISLSQLITQEMGNGDNFQTNYFALAISDNESDM